MKIDGILDTDDISHQALLIAKLCAELNAINKRHEEACRANDVLTEEVERLRKKLSEEGGGEVEN